MTKKKTDAPSADEIRVIETKDGETWANVSDLILFVKYFKEVFRTNAQKDISNENDYLTKEKMESDLETMEIIFSSIDTFLEDLKNDDEV